MTIRRRKKIVNRNSSATEKNHVWVSVICSISNDDEKNISNLLNGIEHLVVVVVSFSFQYDYKKGLCEHSNLLLQRNSIIFYSTHTQTNEKMFGLNTDYWHTTFFYRRFIAKNWYVYLICKNYHRFLFPSLSLSHTLFNFNNGANHSHVGKKSIQNIWHSS